MNFDKYVGQLEFVCELESTRLAIEFTRLIDH